VSRANSFSSCDAPTETETASAKDLLQNSTNTEPEIRPRDDTECGEELLSTAVILPRDVSTKRGYGVLSLGIFRAIFLGITISPTFHDDEVT